VAQTLAQWSRDQTLETWHVGIDPETKPLNPHQKNKIQLERD